MKQYKLAESRGKRANLLDTNSCRYLPPHKFFLYIIAATPPLLSTKYSTRSPEFSLTPSLLPPSRASPNTQQRSHNTDFIPRHQPPPLPLLPPPRTNYTSRHSPTEENDVSTHRQAAETETRPTAQTVQAPNIPPTLSAHPTTPSPHSAKTHKPTFRLLKPPITRFIVHDPSSPSLTTSAIPHSPRTSLLLPAYPAHPTPPALPSPSPPDHSTHPHAFAHSLALSATISRPITQLSEGQRGLF
ncbi:hypothetical protein FGIG_10231 [Fasciola gigantica]|uniref:Uncharacterized protein n=1 Tax=Fasciola gigantica TaxID=46835 RepID=A0A504WY77_FASGI|nr:hypothetical protein FGIG_10231 [Fasciola gigantica]